MSLYNDLTDVLTPYANKIKEVNESLGNVARYGFVFHVEDEGTGKYYNTSGVIKTDSRFYYKYTKVYDCEPGDVFQYSGQSYASASVLYYLNGVFVSAQSLGSGDFTITIPDGVDGVRFQSAQLSAVTLQVKRVYPSNIKDVCNPDDTIKNGNIWMKTENGTEWAEYEYENPFFKKVDYVSIFDDESRYSLTSDTKWYCSKTALAPYSFIDKVKFKSATSGSGQIVIATTEYNTNLYMMNVKVFDINYTEGWNEVEINYNVGNHNNYLLGHKNLNVLYGDYTTLSGAVDSKYMFGGGSYYASGAASGTDVEGTRFAFGSAGGANYKVCMAFDADIYTGIMIKDVYEEANHIELSDISLIPKYKVIEGSVGYVGRWYDYNDGTDTYKVASSDGAYACFKIKGATSLTVVWGGNFSENSCYRYRIDDGEYVRDSVVASGNTISLSDTSEHVVQLIMDGINSGNHYTVGNGIGIKSITTDGTTKAIYSTNKKIAFFGDSLTRGVRALGNETENDPNTNSVFLSYAWYMSRYLNATPIIAGYGSSGILVNGEFSKCINAIDYVVTGVESSDEEVDLIVINHGHNDVGTASGDFITAYNEVLDRFITKYPAVPVMCVTPFNHRFESEIKTCSDAHSECHYINTSSWYLERYYADGPGHLLAEGAEVCGRKLAEKAKELKLI